MSPEDDRAPLLLVLVLIGVCVLCAFMGSGCSTITEPANELRLTCYDGTGATCATWLQHLRQRGPLFRAARVAARRLQ